MYETPAEVISGTIISSTIRDATQSDMDEAEKLHSEGKCQHRVVWDEPAWLYDYRACYTCGKGMGAI